MDLGAPELLIILVIALLVFGSSRLPKMARSLGQASKEFKAATSGGWLDQQVTAAATPKPVQPTPPANEAPAAASAPDVVAPDAATGSSAAVDTPRVGDTPTDEPPSR